MSGGLMDGKRGLIMGLANDRSLAWGIAKKLREQGAELAFSYQGEALERRVRPLAAELRGSLVTSSSRKHGRRCQCWLPSLCKQPPGTLQVVSIHQQCRQVRHRGSRLLAVARRRNRRNALQRVAHVTCSETHEASGATVAQ